MTSLIATITSSGGGTDVRAVHRNVNLDLAPSPTSCNLATSSRSSGASFCSVSNFVFAFLVVRCRRMQIHLRRRIPERQAPMSTDRPSAPSVQVGSTADRPSALPRALARPASVGVYRFSIIGAVSSSSGVIFPSSIVCAVLPRRIASAGLQYHLRHSWPFSESRPGHPRGKAANYNS